MSRGFFTYTETSQHTIQRKVFEVKFTLESQCKQMSWKPSYIENWRLIMFRETFILDQQLYKFAGPSMNEPPEVTENDQQLFTQFMIQRREVSCDGWIKDDIFPFEVKDKSHPKQAYLTLCQNISSEAKDCPYE